MPLEKPDEDNLSKTCHCYQLIVDPSNFKDTPPKAPMFLSGFGSFTIPQQIYIKLFNLNDDSRSRPYLEYKTIKLGKPVSGRIRLSLIFNDEFIEKIRKNKIYINEAKKHIIKFLLEMNQITSFERVSFTDNKYKNLLNSRYEIMFIEKVGDPETDGCLYCTIIEKYSGYISPIKIDIGNLSKEIRDNYIYGNNDEALKYFILNFFHKEVMLASTEASGKVSIRKKTDILMRFFLENTRWGRKVFNRNYSFDSYASQSDEPFIATTPSKQIKNARQLSLTPKTPVDMTRIGTVIVGENKVACFSETTPDKPVQLKYAPRVSRVNIWRTYPPLCLPEINNEKLALPAKTSRKAPAIEIRKEREALNIADTGIARWEACHVYAHRFMIELGKDPDKDNIVLGTNHFNTSMMLVEDAISALRIKYRQQLFIWIDVGIDKNNKNIASKLVYHVSRVEPDFVADSKLKLESRPHFQMNFNAAVNSKPALGLQRPIFEKMEMCLFPESSLNFQQEAAMSSSIFSTPSITESPLLSPMSCSPLSTSDLFSLIPDNVDSHFPLSSMCDGASSSSDAPIQIFDSADIHFSLGFMSSSPEFSPDSVKYTVPGLSSDSDSDGTLSSSESDKLLSDDHATDELSPGPKVLSASPSPLSMSSSSSDSNPTYSTPIRHFGPTNKYNENSLRSKRGTPESKEGLNKSPAKQARGLRSDSINVLAFPLAELPLSPLAMSTPSCSSSTSTFFGQRRSAIRSLNIELNTVTDSQPCKDDEVLSGLSP